MTPRDREAKTNEIMNGIEIDPESVVVVYYKCTRCGVRNKAARRVLSGGGWGKFSYHKFLQHIRQAHMGKKEEDKKEEEGGEPAAKKAKTGGEAGASGQIVAYILYLLAYDLKMWRAHQGQPRGGKLQFGVVRDMAEEEASSFGGDVQRDQMHDLDSSSCLFVCLADSMLKPSTAKMCTSR
ncbi:unnamed protein product [Vitrella brassicaformis CCMP3155]|uniref:Uncharacterized protein n=1 Tax=Vitrella brassicaformis (strain CCMP3155) TaxID=1169540 RepID=A0A0G4GII2_VITBC|nr:unnamed protein product [Vitrella brassicaformis CCMP3155]|eukprot:CEM29678.1 unnamed protein product [Vitrella brassicaformis CCMP3155]